MQKKVIWASKPHAEHSFAGQNTQQRVTSFLNEHFAIVAKTKL